MLSALLSFELKFHIRQTSSIFCVVIFLLLGFILMGRLGVYGSIFVNSPFAIISIYLILSLISTIIVAVVANNAIVRD